MKTQPSVRQINSHVFAGCGYCIVYAQGYCIVYAQGWQARITWARTRKGIKQGRVLNLSIQGSGPAPKRELDRMGMSWVAIPADASVELS